MPKAGGEEVLQGDAAGISSGAGLADLQNMTTHHNSEYEARFNQAKTTSDSRIKKWAVYEVCVCVHHYSLSSGSGQPLVQSLSLIYQF